MFRHVAFFSILLSLQLSSRAESPGNHAMVRKAQAIIIVSQNGMIRVDNARIPLRNLIGVLSKLGVTADSKIVVQGETRTDPKDITRVLETLSESGLLPKDAID
jgi:biopolymer transport protein ExbD